jgi:hypothetical protein
MFGHTDKHYYYNANMKKQIVNYAQNPVLRIQSLTDRTKLTHISSLLFQTFYLEMVLWIGASWYSSLSVNFRKPPFPLQFIVIHPIASHFYFSSSFASRTVGDPIFQKNPCFKLMSHAYYQNQKEYPTNSHFES